MQHLITIKHHDLTDIPPAVSVVDRFTLEAEPKQMKAIKKRIKEVFNIHNDGNDNHFSINVVELPKVDAKSADDVEKWLAEFVAENEIEV